VKSITSAFLAHKSSPNSTVCALLLIAKPGGGYIGLTSHGKRIRYNPSDFDPNLPDVLQDFYPATGVDLSNLQATNDLAVDNGEARTLTETSAYPGQGVTEAMIDNGDMDGAEFWHLLVNFKDLSPTMGHEVMGNGPTGEWRINFGGLVTFECRSWTDYLRQNSVCERDSLTCRVKKFGSQAGEERFPCYYDASGELGAEVTVTAVGTETVREFTAAALGAAADYYAPGNWLWTVGANAGRTLEIESQSAGGDIVLAFTTRHPIQVGDKGRPKRDCSRQWEGHNSCETYDNREWFRGEPKIPVADTINLTIPGAANGGF
jgi:hypothetical protein